MNSALAGLLFETRDAANELDQSFFSLYKVIYSPSSTSPRVPKSL